METWTIECWVSTETKARNRSWGTVDLAVRVLSAIALMTFAHVNGHAFSFFFFLRRPFASPVSQVSSKSMAGLLFLKREGEERRGEERERERESSILPNEFFSAWQPRHNNYTAQPREDPSLETLVILAPVTDNLAVGYINATNTITRTRSIATGVTNFRHLH